MSANYFRSRVCAHCAATFDGQARAKYCSLACHIAFNSRQEENGCWTWLLFTDKDGYGRINSGLTQEITAHRASFESMHGMSADKHVCHSCDNPSCVNPSHLFAGTDADNATDKVRKGRQARGYKIPKTKLTEPDVRAIRADPRSNRAIAKAYGVKGQTIDALKNGKTWGYVQ